MTSCVVYTMHKERGVWVSWLSLKTIVDKFPGFGLKTGYCGLVVWASKLPQRFLGLGLKTKLAMDCQLRHKTDRRRAARDTHRDLVVCFTVKQVGLGFHSLPQHWRRSDVNWCMWYHRGGHVKMKSKMDGSMRRSTSDSSTLNLPSLYYFAVGAF
jgi:hypothetical protein